MTTLTKKIDERIKSAIAEGKEPNYEVVADEVLADLDRVSRKEAVRVGVRLRARYRLRQITAAPASTPSRRSRTRH